MDNNNVILKVYNDHRTVFRLNDIALLTGESDFQSLNLKLNYYVRTGKLQNLRVGIYTKQKYNREELACSVYKPAYISLDYVLQKAGIIFQFQSHITCVSYLSRSIDIDNQTFVYRKIKDEILIDLSGINRYDNFVNIATPERAFLDMLYLETDFYFDNLNPLNKESLFKLLPLYRSKSLEKRVNKLFNHG